MRALFSITIVAVSLALAGCAASGDVMRLSSETAEGEKEIALDAPSAPWVLEIQKRLAKRGFEVERWASTDTITKRTDEDTSETYNESSARYVAIIEGSAPLNWERKCFGGGYNFNYISVDVVDTEQNETMLNISGSGYSEGCPPNSGTIFGDITNAIDELWE